MSSLAQILTIFAANILMPMELELQRIAFRPTYTVGRLYIDGVRFCDTIEDRNRDLNHNGRFDGAEKKVYAETCIPFGRYEVTMNVVSPRFSRKREYEWWPQGKLPRLLNVPHFEGILIHAGSNERSTAGCIIVGSNTVVGHVTDSMPTCKKLYPILRAAADRGEKIWIKIL